MAQNLGHRARGRKTPRTYVERCVLMASFRYEDGGAFVSPMQSTYTWDRGDIEAITMTVRKDGRRVFTITEARPISVRVGGEHPIAFNA